MGVELTEVSKKYFKRQKKEPKIIMVISVNNKMIKKSRNDVDVPCSPIETQLSQAVLEIQNNADNTMKEQLMQLHMVAAKEFDVGGRNAIVISVPAPQVVSWHKIQEKIIRELEKKFLISTLLLWGTVRS